MKTIFRAHSGLRRKWRRNGDGGDTSRSNGSAHFSDPDWSNHNNKYYRINMP